MSRHERIAVRIPDDYREHFDKMAEESGLAFSTLLGSILMDVADDDRAAHGLQPLERPVRIGRRA